MAVLESIFGRSGAFLEWLSKPGRSLIGGIA